MIQMEASTATQRCALVLYWERLTLIASLLSFSRPSTGHEFRAPLNCGFTKMPASPSGCGGLDGCERAYDCGARDEVQLEG